MLYVYVYGSKREHNFPKCFKVFVSDCSLQEGEKVVGASKIVYRASITSFPLMTIVFFNDIIQRSATSDDRGSI